MSTVGSDQPAAAAPTPAEESKAEPVNTYEDSRDAVVGKYLALKERIDADMANNFPEEEIADRIKRKEELLRDILPVRNSIDFYSGALVPADRPEEHVFSKEQRDAFVLLMFNADNSYIYNLNQVGEGYQKSLGYGFMEYMDKSFVAQTAEERTGMQQQAILCLSKITDPRALEMIAGFILQDSHIVRQASNAQRQLQKDGGNFSQISGEQFTGPIFGNGQRFLNRYGFVVSPPSAASELIDHTNANVVDRVLSHRRVIFDRIDAEKYNVLFAMSANERNISGDYLTKLGTNREEDGNEDKYMLYAERLARHDLMIKSFIKARDLDTAVYRPFLGPTDRKALCIEYEARAKRRENPREMYWISEYRADLIEHDGAIFDDPEARMIKGMRLFKREEGRKNFDRAESYVREVIETAGDHNEGMRIPAKLGLVTLCMSKVAHTCQTMNNVGVSKLPEMCRVVKDEMTAILDFAQEFSSPDLQKSRQGYLPPDVAPVLIAKLMKPIKLEMTGRRTRGRGATTYTVKMETGEFREDCYRACNNLLKTCKENGLISLNIDGAPVNIDGLIASQNQKHQEHIAMKVAEARQRKGLELKATAKEKEATAKADEAYRKLIAAETEARAQESKNGLELNSRIDEVLTRTEQRGGVAPVVVAEHAAPAADAPVVVEADDVKEVVDPPYVVQFKKIKLSLDERDYEGALQASLLAAQMAAVSTDPKSDEYEAMACVEAAGYCNILGFRGLKTVARSPSKTTLNEAIDKLKEGDRYLNQASLLLTQERVDSLPTLAVEQPDLAGNLGGCIGILRQDVTEVVSHNERLMQSKLDRMEASKKAAMAAMAAKGKSWRQGKSKDEISTVALERQEAESCVEMLGKYKRRRGVSEVGILEVEEEVEENVDAAPSSAVEQSGAVQAKPDGKNRRKRGGKRGGKR